MSTFNISDSVIYVGADDKKLDLFESQYKIPDGVSYNSYVIKDSKMVVMDTVDNRATDMWFDNLEEAFAGKAPDYLVISHLEPDHAGNIQRFLMKYPDTIVVTNAKAFSMLPQFFDLKLDDSKKIVVKEGDTLNIGKHTLTFVMAPMVHWPEVMVAYEQAEKILFSADGFGRFGALNGNVIYDRAENDGDDVSWAEEARRYFINIVGKYGPSVQALLKKAAALDIKTIAPLHGPVLKGNLGYFIDKYMTWSSYKAEHNGTVVAYASIHGNTAAAAKKFAELLKDAGEENVAVFDLSRDDMAQAVAKAFEYDKLVLAGITYDGVLMPCMEDYLYHLKIKNYQNRKAAIIENGTWGPVAANLIRKYLETMKQIEVCEQVVTIKSVMNDANEEQMKTVISQLL